MKKKMISYCGSAPTALFAAALLAVTGGLGFATDIAEPLIFALIMLGIALICVLVYVLSRSRLNKIIQAYAQRYGGKTLARDFGKSQTVLNGFLRVGEEWLFGKRTNTIVRYDQISKIYLYIHRTNGIEDSRMLTVVADGKTRNLCKVPAKGVFKKQNHPDVEKVIRYVVYKNPHVHVGYK